VTTIHFASSTTHAKCNNTLWCHQDMEALYFHIIIVETIME